MNLTLQTTDNGTQWSDYWRLMRLDKPIGWLLLLWPTLWTLWIAGNGRPDPFVVCVFIIGVILMRSAGCVINDFADRKLDPHVRRTKSRPIAAGQIQPQAALRLFVGLGSIAFGLVLTMNALTIGLALVAIMLAASYPYAKRYTHLPQLHLGLAFGWAAPMAWAAETGALNLTPWIIMTCVVAWVLAYDTMYAMVDREDDLRIGSKSSAILFATADKALIAGFQFAVIVLLISIGWCAGLELTYYITVGVAVLLFSYQQYLIKDRDRSRCLRAFQHNNWVGLIVFVGIAADYLMLTA